MKLQSCLPRISAFFTILASALCVSLLAGCGQKGPLYMPQGQQGYLLPPVQTVPATPATTTVPETSPSTSSDSK